MLCKELDVIWPQLKLWFRNEDAILNLNGALKGLFKTSGFLIPVGFYANVGGRVRQNTTVVGSYLLVTR